MSSCNDRWLSIVTVSGWPAIRTVVRNTPLNMQEMGASTELVWFKTVRRSIIESSSGIGFAYDVVSLSHPSLLVALVRLGPFAK